MPREQQAGAFVVGDGVVEEFFVGCRQEFLCAVRVKAVGLYVLVRRQYGELPILDITQFLLGADQGAAGPGLGLHEHIMAEEAVHVSVAVSPLSEV